jgi:hypothetical protein
MGGTIPRYIMKVSLLELETNCDNTWTEFYNYVEKFEKLYTLTPTENKIVFFAINQAGGVFAIGSASVVRG